jgi:phthalate 4,5-dioxygenase oxygenase subunit
VLSKEDNEFACRVGPGTPMGELFRRFWLPAMLPDEIPHADCPPVRLRLLGEDLVAFRDSNDKIAVVEAHCPHRGASLYFGRNEECGIRCVYHGWKFDVDGNCVDMPSEPPESNFKDKIRITSYPTTVHGGLIWVYMGPEHLRAELPQLEWTRVPESHPSVSKRFQETN